MYGKAIYSCLGRSRINLFYIFFCLSESCRAGDIGWSFVQEKWNWLCGGMMTGQGKSKRHGYWGKAGQEFFMCADKHIPPAGRCLDVFQALFFTLSADNIRRKWVSKLWLLHPSFSYSPILRSILDISELLMRHECIPGGHIDVHLVICILFCLAAGFISWRNLAIVAWILLQHLSEIVSGPLPACCLTCYAWPNTSLWMFPHSQL